MLDIADQRLLVEIKKLYHLQRVPIDPKQSGATNVHPPNFGTLARDRSTASLRAASTRKTPYGGSFSRTSTAEMKQKGRTRERRIRRSSVSISTTSLG
ncbi:MAG: hypothetical protein JWR15_4077 [Prosthecobacter sp.]|nr:hypothetical protein [Prosthecobacter sp.]